MREIDVKKIPVVVPAYEPDEKLSGLLRKLREAGFINIVLVDDGSGEGYVHLFEELVFAKL